MLETATDKLEDPLAEDDALVIGDDPKLGEELNLRRKLLQESVVKRIRQIKTDGKSKAPWVVELDPTSACNLVCPDCISKDLLNQGGFERQRLRELAQEIVEAGVKAVIRWRIRKPAGSSIISAPMECTSGSPQTEP